MDLSLLQAADTAVVLLRHPVSNESLDGVSVTVHGHDSAVFRNAVKERQRAALAKKSGDKLDIDEAEKRSIELLATCIVGWAGIQEDGKDVAYSKESAKYILMKYHWIREQIDAAIADRSNFFANA